MRFFGQGRVPISTSPTGCYATMTSMMALLAGVQPNMTFAFAAVSHLRARRLEGPGPIGQATSFL